MPFFLNGSKKSMFFFPKSDNLDVSLQNHEKKKKYCPPGTLPAFSVIHTPLVTLRYPYPFQPHQEALPPCLPCSTPIFYIYPDTLRKQSFVPCAPVEMPSAHISQLATPNISSVPLSSSDPKRRQHIGGWDSASLLGSRKGGPALMGGGGHPEASVEQL